MLKRPVCKGVECGGNLPLRHATRRGEIMSTVDLGANRNFEGDFLRAAGRRRAARMQCRHSRRQESHSFQRGFPATKAGRILQEATWQGSDSRKKRAASQKERAAPFRDLLQTRANACSKCHFPCEIIAFISHRYNEYATQVFLVGYPFAILYPVSNFVIKKHL